MKFPADLLTFIGTATTLVRLGPFTVLTDPNFLHRGQWSHFGQGLVSRRRTEPAAQVADLPPLDGVVLSHLHRDHFDRVTRRHLPADVPILTTERAARRLAKRGFQATIDLAVLHLGGARVLGVRVTMDDRQGGRMLEMMNPTHVVPVHFDDYGKFTSPVSNFFAVAGRRHPATDVRLLTRGESFSLANLLSARSPG